MNANDALKISKENKYKKIDSELLSVFSEIETQANYGRTSTLYYGLSWSQENRLNQLGYVVTRDNEEEGEGARFIISWDMQ